MRPNDVRMTLTLLHSASSHREEADDAAPGVRSVLLIELIEHTVAFDTGHDVVALAPGESRHVKRAERLRRRLERVLPDRHTRPMVVLAPR